MTVERLPIEQRLDALEAQEHPMADLRDRVARLEREVGKGAPARDGLLMACGFALGAWAMSELLRSG